MAADDVTSPDALADIANLYLGGFLACAPNIFGFETGPENVNAHVAGVGIIVLAMAAIYAHVDWEEWLNLLLGLWLIAAPWFLQFSSASAVNVHVVVGILVAALAGMELWLTHRHATGQGQGVTPT
jgi:SPW repeat-containing protein